MHGHAEYAGQGMCTVHCTALQNMQDSVGQYRILRTQQNKRDSDDRAEYGGHDGKCRTMQQCCGTGTGTRTTVDLSSFSLRLL
jgi:hypothetical protein